MKTSALIECFDAEDQPKQLEAEIRFSMHRGVNVNDYEFIGVSFADLQGVDPDLAERAARDWFDENCYNL